MQHSLLSKLRLAGFWISTKPAGPIWPEEEVGKCLKEQSLFLTVFKRKERKDNHCCSASNLTVLRSVDDIFFPHCRVNYTKKTIQRLVKIYMDCSGKILKKGQDSYTPPPPAKSSWIFHFAVMFSGVLKIHTYSFWIREWIWRRWWLAHHYKREGTHFGGFLGL